MTDEKVKALANDIITMCHQRRLTYRQMWMMLNALQGRYGAAADSCSFMYWLSIPSIQFVAPPFSVERSFLPLSHGRP